MRATLSEKHLARLRSFGGAVKILATSPAE